MISFVRERLDFYDTYARHLIVLIGENRALDFSRVALKDEGCDSKFVRLVGHNRKSGRSFCIELGFVRDHYFDGDSIKSTAWYPTGRFFTWTA